jgi:hypothetical protein
MGFMAGRLRPFATSELGAAKTQAGFAIAAGLGVILMVGIIALNGGPVADRSPPRLSPEEAALAQMLEAGMQQFTPTQASARFDIYMDPSQRTDAQLRNAHRIWAERSGNPAYGEPELAADMFAIIDNALRLRGVRPHDGL